VLKIEGNVSRLKAKPAHFVRRAFTNKFIKPGSAHSRSALMVICWQVAGMMA